jgi:hypothetical protein
VSRPEWASMEQHLSDIALDLQIYEKEMLSLRK